MAPPASADGASPAMAEDQLQSDGTSHPLFSDLPAIGRDWPSSLSLIFGRFFDVKLVCEFLLIAF